MQINRAGAVLARVGRRVAKLRRARGLTQEALAERMRVLPRYLQRVESGRENLTLRSLVRFANSLGVDVSELLAPERPRTL